MPADKDTSPATETDGESVNTEQKVNTGQAEAPAVLNALQSELAAERAKRIEVERESQQRYDNLRSLQSRQASELAELRRLRDQVEAGQGEEIPQDNPRLTREVLATREELAWIRFRQDHPKYTEMWDEMKEIVKDPTVKRTVETFREGPDGRLVLDTFATLHNAYNEVELRRIRKAQSSTATRKAESAATTKQIRAQATISGNGAASEDNGADYGIPLDELMAMDYDDIIKDPRYKKFINPLDPPRGT